MKKPRGWGLFDKLARRLAGVPKDAVDAKRQSKKRRKRRKRTKK